MCCGSGRNRTSGALRFKQPLFQLSYRTKIAADMLISAVVDRKCRRVTEPRVGFEPTPLVYKTSASAIDASKADRGEVGLWITYMSGVSSSFSEPTQPCVACQRSFDSTSPRATTAQPAQAGLRPLTSRYSPHSQSPAVADDRAISFEAFLRMEERAGFEPARL